MLGKNQSQPSITLFRQKIVLIISGFFVCFILLELGLRLGGFIFFTIQANKNKVSLQQRDVYRIICLGESTTAGQYPSYLNEILNQRSSKIKFSLIDKGVTGTHTTAIINQLESYINEYHPDMVVTMMGINDTKYHSPVYRIMPTSKIIVFF